MSLPSRKSFSQFCPSRLIAACLLGFVAVSAIGNDKKALPVIVASPEQSSASTQELRLTGTVTAAQDARLSPRVDGLVKRVHVDAGDSVRKGDLLLELDSMLATHLLRRSEAETAQARANLNEAERLLAEAGPLVEKKHLPKTELDRRKAAVVLAAAKHVAAKAAEAESRERVQRHRLMAPFGGVVIHKATEVGEWVTRGTPVLRLVSTGDVRLDVRAPQERFGDFGDDTAVDIAPDASGGRLMAGRILSRVPVSDSESRSFLVRVVASASDVALMPGSSAVAIFRFDSDSESLLIPRDAISRHPDGGISVFGVDASKPQAVARRFNIKTGKTVGDRLEVLSGLPDNMAVVVRGNELLRDGQAVKIVQPGN